MFLKVYGIIATEKVDGLDSHTVKLIPLTQTDPFSTVITSVLSYSKVKKCYPFSFLILLQIAVVSICP